MTYSEGNNIWNNKLFTFSQFWMYIMHICIYNLYIYYGGHNIIDFLLRNGFSIRCIWDDKCVNKYTRNRGIRHSEIFFFSAFIGMCVGCSIGENIASIGVWYSCSDIISNKVVKYSPGNTIITRQQLHISMAQL